MQKYSQKLILSVINNFNFIQFQMKQEKEKNMREQKQNYLILISFNA